MLIVAGNNNTYNYNNNSHNSNSNNNKQNYKENCNELRKRCRRRARALLRRLKPSSKSQQFCPPSRPPFPILPALTRLFIQCYFLSFFAIIYIYIYIYISWCVCMQTFGQESFHLRLQSALAGRLFAQKSHRDKWSTLRVTEADASPAH